MADAVKDYLAAIGRRGGKATSEAKRLAAAANGRKGGRPKNSCEMVLTYASRLRMSILNKVGIGPANNEETDNDGD